MSDSDNNEVKAGSKAEQEKLLAIRDIIFGNEIQEYNQEFETLKSLIEKNKEDSDKKDDKILEKLNAMEKSLNDSIAGLEEKLSLQIKNLDESKTDRQKLGDFLEELGKKLKA